MNYQLVQSRQDLSNFFLDFRKTTILFLDTETSSLDIFSSELFLIQINTTYNIYVFDVRKLGKVFTTYLIQLIKDSRKLVVGHNIKYDLKILLFHTGELLTNVYDTMLTEILLTAGVGEKFYSLSELVDKYCEVVLDKEIRDQFINASDISDDMLEYAATDVKYLPVIYKQQMELIEKNSLLRTLELECKLAPVVADMEYTGVHLDDKHWNILTGEAFKNAEKLKEDIVFKVSENILRTLPNKNLLEYLNLIGVPVTTKKDKTLYASVTEPSAINRFLVSLINVSSPQQIKNIIKLYHSIDVESTSEKILKEYKEFELINKILEYRENFKKGTSFGKSFIEKINPVTGKIHAEFNQLGTASGRFSSGKPNLQQIVRDSEYRDCFIADPGYKIITIDYSQQELRIAGALSREPKFITAFNTGLDLHTLTASILFEVDYANVTKEQRYTAKTWNFAVLYGSTEYGLNYNFGWDIAEARDLLKKYYEGYPKLSEFKSKFEDLVEKLKYSTTMLGRKRFFESRGIFEDIKEYERYIKKIRREGFNHAIQGTGADITKSALCNIFYNNIFGDDLKIIMCVHDEIVCLVEESIAEKAKEFIEEQMLMAEQIFLKEIPASVDGKISNVWSK